MRFLIGSRLLVLIDRDGFRWHMAPKNNHFEKVGDIFISRPKAEDKTVEDIAQDITGQIADRTINQALQFHADRMESVLKLVLKAGNASEASDIVAEEIRHTEERMQERQESIKV